MHPNENTLSSPCWCSNMAEDWEFVVATLQGFPKPSASASVFTIYAAISFPSSFGECFRISPGRWSDDWNGHQEFCNIVSEASELVLQELANEATIPNMVAEIRRAAVSFSFPIISPVRESPRKRSSIDRLEVLPLKLQTSLNPLIQEDHTGLIYLTSLSWSYHP